MLGLVLLVRIGFFYLGGEKREKVKDGIVSLEGRVATAPKVTARAQIWEQEGYKIVARRLPEIEYGDLIKIAGKAKEGTVVYPEIIISGMSGNLGMSGIYKIKKRLVETIQGVLPEPEAGLAAGILLGYKAGLNENLSLNLRKLGLTHVVAASGVNLTFVLGGIVILTGVLGRRKIIILALPLIWFYAIMCGFEAPVVIAGNMATLSFGAILAGREMGGFRGLGLAGYLIILANPAVVFDLGFQLSMAAMAGILVAGMKADVISQTISAQAATAPIILANFGMINILTLMENS